MNDHDTLRRFVFENAPVRGEIVRLNATWRAVLERHAYPRVVRDTLGEYLAASALLSGTIKYDGSLTLQVQGSGPITLLIAECTSQRTLRGLAHWTGDVRPGPLSELTGSGQVAITIDPGPEKERYQGIVELHGDTIAEALGHYLERSEQLSTRLWLGADSEIAAGLLLQKLPNGGRVYANEDDDLWNRAVQLASTITPEELIDLPPKELIRRLFHEEDVRLFESEPVSFRCGCSRERVRTMLRALGTDEVHDIIKERGSVSVTCEFCNQRYEFDAVDAEQLFAADAPPAVPPTRH
jgi:molecular chaperone Hsp33